MKRIVNKSILWKAKGTQLGAKSRLLPNPKCYLIVP